MKGFSILGRRRRAEAKGNFDRDFYLRRNPDVVASGMDPKEHFIRYGAREGRPPNEEEEERLRLASRFDTKWYLKRNPDVASAGVDPFEHFMKYGRNERRAANAEEEPRKNWIGRFDETWYLTRYPDVASSGEDALDHYIKYGLLESRFPNRAEEALTEWSGKFDAAWYIKRNPDVAESGIDPLKHFVTQGILEHRRPHPQVKLPSRPTTEAQVYSLKDPTPEREVALFVTHSGDGSLKPHVPIYLHELTRNRIPAVLVVATNVVSVDIPSDLSSRLNGIIVRQNNGYDFAAWAHVIRLHPELLKADLLYLINDSVIGPTNDLVFSRLLTQIRAHRADVIGLTESVERGWHLQSYFIALKRPVLMSDAFRSFIDSIVAFENKDDVVNEYETRFSLLMKSAGFTCEAMFPIPGAINPTLYHWKALLQSGYPFIKVSTVRDNFPREIFTNLDKSDWRETLELQGYDVSIIDRMLAEFWRSSTHPRAHLLGRFYSFLSERVLLEFPYSPNPSLSIIIISDGRAELTFRCLSTLVEAANTLVEIIIVDNASSDDTRYLLNRINGAKIVRNIEDLGFTRAANQGASRARGNALLFLGSDCSLEASSIQAALSAFAGLLDIGAVCGQVISPEGILSEAGCIIWADGRVEKFGIDRSSKDLDLRFRREVDSGDTGLFVDRCLFERVRRFDPTFASHSYAVADLCLRIHNAGFRVIYDHRIQVLQATPSKQNNNREARQNTSKDQQLFQKRHAVSLAKRHLSPGSSFLTARAVDRWRPRLLLLSGFENQFWKEQSADSTNVIEILRSLSNAGYFVTFGVMSHLSGRLDQMYQVLPADVECIDLRVQTAFDQMLLERAGYYQALIVGQNAIYSVHRYFVKHSDHLRGLKLIHFTTLSHRRGPAAEFDLGRDLDLSTMADAVIVSNRNDLLMLKRSGHVNVHMLSQFDEPTSVELVANILNALRTVRCYSPCLSDDPGGAVNHGGETVPWLSPRQKRHERHDMDDCRDQIEATLPAGRMSADLAVVYLARGADDNYLESFDRFLSSYEKRAAGAKHDLFVVIKGFERQEDIGIAKEMFQRVDPTIIELPDMNFDIGAYISAADVINNEYLCFLNTHSEILCDDWLYFLSAHARRPNVGLVGATGSFECHEVFGSNTVFPNAHIRSNAFVIRRKMFQSILGLKIINEKEDAYSAECGPHSLTRQIMAKGYDAFIVGKNGRSYSPLWWPGSGTFRQGSQENLLVGDNQTRLFAAAAPAERDRLMKRAWGSYLDLDDFLTGS